MPFLYARRARRRSAAAADAAQAPITRDPVMRFFYLVLLIVIVIFGVSFAVENKDPVVFRYFVGSAEVALAWLLVLTLALGALLGMLASVGVILRLRRELRAHKRRATQAADSTPRESQATRPEAETRRSEADATRPEPETTRPEPETTRSEPEVRRPDPDSTQREKTL